MSDGKSSAPEPDGDVLVACRTNAFEQTTRALHRLQPLNGNGGMLLGDKADLRVSEIMTKDVHAVGVNVDAEAAWHHMRRAGVRHLVVLGDADAVVGVLSDRDYVGHETSTLARRTVRELMTESVVVGSLDLTIRDAAKLMRDHVISCLPVVSDTRVIGILTTHDLLTLIVGDAAITSTDPVVHGGKILR